MTHEIEYAREALEKEGKDVVKLSVVGYSLGGLVARYAIGLLLSKGWFETIQAVVSLASQGYLRFQYLTLM